MRQAAERGDNGRGEEAASPDGDRDDNGLSPR
jgi:hypothetical protein